MKRRGVCPSVSSIRPLLQRAAGLLLWARRVGDIDQLLHGAAATKAGSAWLKAEVGSWT